MASDRGGRGFSGSRDARRIGRNAGGDAHRSLWLGTSRSGGLNGSGVGVSGFGTSGNSVVMCHHSSRDMSRVGLGHVSGDDVVDRRRGDRGGLGRRIGGGRLSGGGSGGRGRAGCIRHGLNASGEPF